MGELLVGPWFTAGAIRPGRGRFDPGTRCQVGSVWHGGLSRAGTAGLSQALAVLQSGSPAQMVVASEAARAERAFRLLLAQDHDDRLVLDA
jgi:hypothetical protein